MGQSLKVAISLIIIYFNLSRFWLGEIFITRKTHSTMRPKTAVAYFLGALAAPCAARLHLGASSASSAVYSGHSSTCAVLAVRGGSLR